MQVKDMITPQQDPAGKMAEFVSKLKYEQIPAEQIEYVKRDVLDELGNIIAGSKGPAVPQVLALCNGLCGGQGKGRVLVHGTSASPEMAAFVNGVMARSQDMGDTHTTGGHITEWIIPALMTDMTLRDGKLSGKDFITAFVGGAEWGAREHVCIHLQFHTTTMPGECAGSRYATAALAKFRHLNPEDFWTAQGFAFSIDPQHEQQKYNEGTSMVRVQHGFVVSHALMAVELTKQGLDSMKGIYMGTSGLLKNIWHGDTESPDFLTDRLGERWVWFEGITMKPYGGCKYHHTPIYALLNEMKEKDFTWQEIEHLHYVVSGGCRCTLEPHDAKWAPHTPAECLFSNPYAIAHSAMTGDCFLDAFFQETIDAHMADPAFIDLMNRMTFEIDSSIKTPFDNYTMTVTLKDGRSFTRLEGNLLGNAVHPMDWEDVEHKFWNSTRFAAVDLGKEKYQKIIDLCKNLDQLEDVHELLDAMMPD